MAILKTSIFVLFFVFRYGVLCAQFHSNTVPSNNSISNSTGTYSLYKPVNRTSFSLSNQLSYTYRDSIHNYNKKSFMVANVQDSILNQYKQQAIKQNRDIKNLYEKEKGKSVPDPPNYPFLNHCKPNISNSKSFKKTINNAAPNSSIGAFVQQK